jgi:hypothetical protein
LPPFPRRSPNEIPPARQRCDFVRPSRSLQSGGLDRRIANHHGWRTRKVEHVGPGETGWIGAYPSTYRVATDCANHATPIQASDVYLNHFCLLSDHSNLCSRTTMHPDWPGHSLKLEPMNGTGKTLTGTLVIEYDASKIEPAVDGNLRHSVKHTTTAFEKSPGKLTIRNFVVQPGKDYQYLWNRIKPNASGTVIGKATFSWLQDNQTKYAIGCYEFQIGSEGGTDNIQGLEKSKFNGYGGMDCGNPSIPK